ncbi:MAG: TOMM precursor leader peptide-binding protein [Candidatus Hodarchaeota archaeon]
MNLLINFKGDKEEKNISKNEEREYKTYTGDEFREYIFKFITRFNQRKETISIETDEKLKKLEEQSIVIIGLGKIGSNLLFSLSPIGIGKISIFDDHIVDKFDIESNIFSKEDLGKKRINIFQNLFRNFEGLTDFEWNPYGDDDAQKDDIIRRSDLVVLCLDQDDPESINYVNETCLTYNRSWLSARFLEYYGEVGPTVIPFKTSCFKCYEYRLKGTRDEKEESLVSGVKVLSLDEIESQEQIHHQNLDSFMKIISEYTSLEIVRMLTGHDKPNTLGAVMSLNLRTYRNTLHPILKIPTCPACGYKEK